jgi:hypothetical protein
MHFLPRAGNESSILGAEELDALFVHADQAQEILIESMRLKVEESWNNLGELWVFLAQLTPERLKVRTKSPTLKIVNFISSRFSSLN